jgi:hypothetical protein
MVSFASSGTLSPLDSFAGELGIPFPIRLEAAHVINVQEQVSRLMLDTLTS